MLDLLKMLLVLVVVGAVLLEPLGSFNHMRPVIHLLLHCCLSPDAFVVLDGFEPYRPFPTWEGWRPCCSSELVLAGSICAEGIVVPLDPVSVVVTEFLLQEVGFWGLQFIRQMNELSSKTLKFNTTQLTPATASQMA